MPAPVFFLGNRVGFLEDCQKLGLQWDDLDVHGDAYELVSKLNLLFYLNGSKKLIVRVLGSLESNIKL